MQLRRLMHRVWAWLAQERRLLEILALLLLTYLVVLVLPQAPMPVTDGALFARWLAEQRTRWGEATDLLAMLGLFTIRTAPFTRVLIGGLGLLLAVRAELLWAEWEEMRASRRRWLLLACVGSVALLVGWGMQLLWGWQQAEILVWDDAPVQIPEPGRPGEVLHLPAQPGWLPWQQRYGLYLLPRPPGLGLQVRAADAQGEPLLLLPSSKDEPRSELALALTPAVGEHFFLIPQAELILRVSRPPEALDGEVLVQVYRSASGELLLETMLEEASLTVGEVEVHMEPQALTRLQAVYNPGALPEAAGVGLLAVSSLALFVHREEGAAHAAADVERGEGGPVA